MCFESLLMESNGRDSRFCVFLWTAPIHNLVEFFVVLHSNLNSSRLHDKFDFRIRFQFPNRVDCPI